VPKIEYKTEVLTSTIGRDKLRMDDLDRALRRHGDDGWELVSVSLDANLKGTRDGHLLIFKRPVDGASAAEAHESKREPAAEVSDAWAQGFADAERAAAEDD
jgi:hypothetical protein